MAEPAETASTDQAGPSSSSEHDASAPTTVKPSASATVQSEAGPSTRSWTLPPKLTARPVRPDILTDPAVLRDPTALAGTATDPGRMGIWLCLKDDRPHLHPSLLALHKHRLAAHGTPIPPEPSKTLPVSASDGEEWVAWKFSEEEEARRKAYLPLA